MYKNQNGAVPVFMIIAAIGLISFLVLVNVFDFRNTIFNALFPKPLSNAASCNQAPNNPSYAQINVRVPSTGDYVIWSRIMSQGNTSNSFYLQVDNNSCILIIGDSNTIPTGAWTWIDFSDGNPATKSSVNLTAGDHTLKIIGRESNVKVDEIMLTNDPTCTSVDSVGQCIPASTPTPTPTSTPTSTPTPTPTSSPTSAPSAPVTYDKSVTDYGAKGDGTTNDTTAFTNAIAATPTGGTLFVPKPASAYLINGTINVNKAIKIVGEDSTLRKSSGIVLLNIASSNVTIDKLRLIGPGNAGVAVYSETANITGIVIQNNYIQGWLDGIALTRTSGLKILNNNIRNSLYAGIALTGTVGSYTGAGKPTVAELRSGVDLTGRFSIAIDGNTIYDVKGNGDGSRNAYGITISDDGTMQPARALVVRNRVEYVSTWECYDTHAGKELYFLDNYCYMAMRAFNLSSDSRYTNKVTDVYAVRNTVVKGPQGALPAGIGMPGDIFSSTSGAPYASLESIILVDSSSNGPAAGGVYDNKLFGYGFTGWSGIDVRNTTLAPVSGNICYQSVTGDVNSTSKPCP